MSPSTKRILREARAKRFNYRILLIEITWLDRRYGNFGWGNGYVCIPPGHPCHGRHYDDIPVDVHGGLTFASNTIHSRPDVPNNYWIVGFDTAHCMDTLERWPMNRVLEEAQHLQQQLKDLAEVKRP